MGNLIIKLVLSIIVLILYKVFHKSEFLGTAVFILKLLFIGIWHTRPQGDFVHGLSHDRTYVVFPSILVFLDLGHNHFILSALFFSRVIPSGLVIIN